MFCELAVLQQLSARQSRGSLTCLLLVGGVENDIDEVETRQQGWGQLNVLHNGHAAVPARLCKCPVCCHKND